MTGLSGKLRQFISNWLPATAVSAPPADQASTTFIFNADDSPRLWSEDVVLCWPPTSKAWPKRAFPRFKKLATTNDADRLAA